MKSRNRKIKDKKISYWWDYVNEKGKEVLTWLHCFSWHYITKYSFEVEMKKDFTLLSKVNTFRESKTEKEKSVAVLYVALGKLESDVKILE